MTTASAFFLALAIALVAAADRSSFVINEDQGDRLTSCFLFAWNEARCLPRGTKAEWIAELSSRTRMNVCLLVANFLATAETLIPLVRSSRTSCCCLSQRIEGRPRAFPSDLAHCNCARHQFNLAYERKYAVGGVRQCPSKRYAPVVIRLSAKARRSVRGELPNV